MKKILVAGSNSFIGNYFINNEKINLVNEVCLIDAKPNDIDFKEYDTVLHLAAIVHQNKTIPEEEYFKVNTDLAYNVALRAKEGGVSQFVFMSTAKVYGESTFADSFWDENSECNPVDPYGKSKLNAERLILSLQDKNFKVAVIRSPLVYGPGVKANMFSLIRLVDRFSFLPLGGINNSRSMVFIGNLIALINHIISVRASGVFIAGDIQPLSTSHLVKLIGECFGKNVKQFALPRFFIAIINNFLPSLVSRLYGSLVINNSNTNKLLGFNPPYSSKEGICEMVQWYKSIK